MTFGSSADERESVSILDATTEAGVNFIDTANRYSSDAPDEREGMNEEIIGGWLKVRRERFIPCHQGTYLPSKTRNPKAAQVLPTIPKELIEEFVNGPMRAEAVNVASMAFKKALIERALGAQRRRCSVRRLFTENIFFFKVSFDGMFFFTEFQNFATRGRVISEFISPAIVYSEQLKS